MPYTSKSKFFTDDDRLLIPFCMVVATEPQGEDGSVRVRLRSGDVLTLTKATGAAEFMHGYRQWVKEGGYAFRFGKLQ